MSMAGLFTRGITSAMARREHSIEDLRRKRATALARAHRYEARAANQPPSHRVFQWRTNARKARKFADELKERIEIMRHKDEGPVMGDKSLPWRNLGPTRTIGGKSYPPNSVLPDGIEQTRNFRLLVQRGLIGQVPAVPALVPKPAPARPDKGDVPNENISATDAIDAVLAEIERLSNKHRCNPYDCFDRVDRSLWERAVGEYGAMEKTIMSGAWGSGGVPTASGVGTHRRLTDGFSEFLLSRLAQRRKAA
jgi:hypothetical protein